MESDTPLTAGAFRRDAYPFERRRNTRRDLEEAEEARAILIRRLGVADIDALPSNVQELLLRYATVCHLNILWYQERREREQRRYHAFVGAAFVALVVTPAATFVLSTQVTSALVPLLTAVLTGLLAMLKFVGSYLERRRLVGLFWNAEANLKSDLYAFEDRWRGKVFETRTGEASGEPPRAVDEEFIVDLKQRIRNAEQVRRTEQDAFFSRYDELPFDISQILSSTTRTARTFTTTFARSGETRDEIEAEVVETTRHLELVEEQLNRANARLAELEGKTTRLAEANQQALMDEIEQLHRLRTELQVDLAEKLAKIGVPR